jgi:tetratricopeptide (TPR) repeat protein
MEDKIYGIIREAEGLRQKSRYKDSLRLFKKALSLSRRHGELNGALDATIAIADIYRMLGDFDAAVSHYEDALEAGEALGDGLSAADCMAGMGLSLRAMGMWKEAIRFISGARRIYKKNKDKKGVAFSLWAEAGALRFAGLMPKAIEKFKDAKDIFSSINFKPGIAYSLCGLGGAHRVSGRFKESMQYYKKANKMFGSLKDKFGSAYSHCGIGNAFRMKKNYEDAIRHFKKAAGLYEEIGDIVSYSYTLWSLANVYKMKGDFRNVRFYIKMAQRNFKKTKDPRGLIYCDLTLGETAFMEGKRAVAEGLFASSMKSAKSHSFRLEGCHAETLLAWARRSGPAAKSLKKTAGCYKKIGVDLNFGGIPFNMP